MKKIKLFEELNQDRCLVSEKTITEFIREYLSTDYFSYFEDAIESYEESNGINRLDNEYNVLDAIRYFDNPEVYIDDDGVQIEGKEDLVKSIKNFLEHHAHELINKTIKEILSEKVKENDDIALVQYKDVFDEWKIKLPDNLRRANDSGLLNIKNK